MAAVDVVFRFIAPGLDGLIEELRKTRLLLQREIEIKNCKSAMARRAARMRELWLSVDFPEQDEHEAALGGCEGEYHRLRDQQNRAGQWLCVLLAKRGTKADLALANAIIAKAWP